jgi:hypothetical protein
MSYFLLSEKEISFPTLIIGLFKYERLHNLHSQSTPCGVCCHGSETAKGHKCVSESQTVKLLVRRRYFVHHATNRTHYGMLQLVRLSIPLNTHATSDVSVSFYTSFLRLHFISRRLFLIVMRFWCFRAEKQ